MNKIEINSDKLAKGKHNNVILIIDNEKFITRIHAAEILYGSIDTGTPIVLGIKPKIAGLKLLLAVMEDKNAKRTTKKKSAKKSRR